MALRPMALLPYGCTNLRAEEFPLLAPESTDASARCTIVT